MITGVSTTGQVVLPTVLRKHRRIPAGGETEVELDGGRVVMTPVSAKHGPVQIVLEPLTGLPVLTVGTDMPT